MFRFEHELVDSLRTRWALGVAVRAEEAFDFEMDGGIKCQLTRKS